MTALNLSLIGCSDYPTLIGANPYSSLFGLWCRLKGRPEPERPAWLDRAARWGLAMEPAIFSEWCRVKAITPGKVINNLSCEPTARPWQRYTPDMVLDVPASVQLKAISTRRFQREGWGEDGSDRVPDRIRAQVIGEIEAMRADAVRWQEMGVDPFEIRAADVAVCEIGFGSLEEIHTYSVPYDADFAAMLVEEAVRFWVDHVIADEPPEPDGSDYCTDAIEGQHPIAGDEYRLASPMDEDLVRKITDLDEEIDRLSSDRSQAKNLLLARIGGAKGMEGKGWRANWYNKKGATSWKSIAETLLSEKDDETKAALLAAHTGKASRVFSLNAGGDR